MSNKNRLNLNYEKFISQIFNDKSKARFIQNEQICFNGCDIKVIDQVGSKYQKIKKLLLSHNKIKNLDGINQFLNMKYLSIQFNQIDDVKEFEKLPNRDILIQLNVKGNPLELHPDHKMKLIELFPKLTKLDDLSISQEFRVLLQKSKSKLTKLFIPLLLYVDQLKQKIENVYKKLKLNMQFTEIDSDFINKFKTSKIIDLNEYDNLQQIYQYLMKDQRQKDLHLSIQTLNWIVDQFDDIIGKIQGTDRKQIQDLYKQTFDLILLNYESKYDKSLKQFLIDRAINNKKIDLQQFVCDSQYSFKCILFEFYKIFPQQAEINGLICIEHISQKEKLRLKDNFQNPFGGNFSALSPNNYSNQIHNFNENSNKKLNIFDVDDQNPDIIENLQLSHFPVFIANENYLNILIQLIYDKIYTVNQLNSQVVQLEKERNDYYLKQFSKEKVNNVYDEVSKLALDSPKKMKKKLSQTSIHKKYQQQLDKQKITKNRNKLIQRLEHLFLSQKQAFINIMKSCQIELNEQKAIKKVAQIFVYKMKQKFMSAIKMKTLESKNLEKNSQDLSQKHYENVLKRKSILGFLKQIYEIKLDLKRLSTFYQNKLIQKTFQILVQNGLSSKKNTLIKEITKLETNEANYDSTIRNDFTHEQIPSIITMKKKPFKNQSFDNVLSHTHRCYFRKCGACQEQNTSISFFQ